MTKNDLHALRARSFFSILALRARFCASRFTLWPSATYYLAFKKKLDENRSIQSEDMTKKDARAARALVLLAARPPGSLSCFAHTLSAIGLV